MIYTFWVVFTLMEYGQVGINYLCPDLRPLPIGWINQDAICPWTGFSGISTHDKRKELSV
jgi:hypothetical protein